MIFNRIFNILWLASVFSATCEYMKWPRIDDIVQWMIIYLECVKHASHILQMNSYEILLFIQIQLKIHKMQIIFVRRSEACTTRMYPFCVLWLWVCVLNCADFPSSLNLNGTLYPFDSYKLLVGKIEYIKKNEEWKIGKNTFSNRFSINLSTLFRVDDFCEL